MPPVLLAPRSRLRRRDERWNRPNAAAATPARIRRSRTMATRASVDDMAKSLQTQAAQTLARRGSGRPHLLGPGLAPTLGGGHAEPSPTSRPRGEVVSAG